MTNHPLRAFTIITLALTLGVHLVAKAGQSKASTTAAQDSDVMAAMIEAAYEPFKSGWVLLDAHAATFACRPTTRRIIDVGGCSGMLGDGETPEQRLDAVKRDVPQVTREILSDLLAKGAQATDTPPLSTSVPHAMWAPGLDFPSTVRGNPVFAATLSRPGFDARREHALVYIATMNWTDRSKSMGQYVFLERPAGKWVPTGHSLVWGQP